MKKTSIAIAVGLACLSASSASASSMNFLGVGANAVVSIQSPVLGNLTVHAGELKWQWNGATPSGYASTFYTYCIDANHYVTNPETVTLKSTTLLANPGVTDSGGKAAWLFNTYSAAVHESGIGTESAALQVAIWAALYNPTNSLTTGPFKLYTTGTIATKAQDYLNALYTGPGGYNSAVATWLDSASAQDQIVNPVPEPASLVLFGTGLAGLSRALRRRRRTLQP